MGLGKKKILAALLEKDDLKLLTYEVGGLGGKVTRLFAGQITFSPEVVRDGFIADAAKYDSQIKMAFSQKEPLREPTEVWLFLSPDKTFTKTLAAADTVDAFVHGLPYFKEELIINSEPASAKSSGGQARTTYVAFEKKLVEDAQRPFLEAGKRIVGVKSEASVLAAKFAQTGRYLFLIPLEKEMVAAVCENGEILDLIVVKNDLLTARLGEFLSNHNLAGMTAAYAVGVVPDNLVAKIRSENNINIVSLAQMDVYDLIISSSLSSGGEKKLPAFLSKLPVPNQRYLFLIGAAAIGVVLTILVVKNVGGLSLPGSEKKVTSPVTPEVPAPAPAPAPKPADYPVAILNGTLVTGEAGRLAEKLKGLGFEVTETKNATTAGFVATRLRTVPGVPEPIISQLKTTLLETYESVSQESLATSSGKAVVEIIIGQKKSP